ncbi:hypothetical protein [Streptomyces sp. NPDC002845]
MHGSADARRAPDGDRPLGTSTPRAADRARPRRSNKLSKRTAWQLLGYFLLDTGVITRRLAALPRSGGQDLGHGTVRAIVHQAVHDVGIATAPPAEPPADLAVAELRRVVDQLAASTHAIGELLLEVAPAYLSDTDAADVLAPLCEAIGEDLENGFAARRYALSRDRRALHGTVPCRPPLPAAL